jgi:hypothetical protein
LKFLQKVSDTATADRQAKKYVGQPPIYST